MSTAASTVVDTLPTAISLGKMTTLTLHTLSNSFIYQEARRNRTQSAQLIFQSPTPGPQSTSKISPEHTHNRTTNYYLQGCQFGEIQATLGKIASRISLKECLFSNSYDILFTSTIKQHLQHNGESDGIHIIDCTITSTELTGDTLPPIKALYKGFTPYPPLIHFTTESRIICNESQAPTIYRLTAEPLNARGNNILHATKIDDNNRTGNTPTFSWEYTCIL